MDHKNLQPLKGASAREKTAFTMKTIKELLAEETESAKATPADETPQPQAADEAGAPAPAAKEAAPVEAAAPQVDPRAPEPEPEEPAAQAPRSFLGRLIGR